MKITDDARTHTLRLVFRDAPIAESDEGQPGMILDCDATGNVVSMVILDASDRVTDPRLLEYRAST
jgi:uncharacterized protein YuzE